MTLAERNTLVEAALPMVRRVASRVWHSTPTWVRYDDLYAVGALAATSAMDDYDPARQKSATAYAYGRVLGAILDYLREEDWLPRVSRQRLKAASAAEDDLRAELGREPSEAEIHERMGLTAEKRRGLAHARRMDASVSLDALVPGMQHPTPFIETICGTEPDPQDCYVREEQHRAVCTAVGRLPEPHRTVIVSVDLRGEPQTAMVQRMRLSNGRISQIRTEALAQLRAMLADDPAA